MSLIKKVDEVVTQEVTQDTGGIPLSPPPHVKKIMAAKKKSSPARFVSPMQGVITKEDSQVVLECGIDGECVYKCVRMFSCSCLSLSLVIVRVCIKFVVLLLL